MKRPYNYNPISLLSNKKTAAELFSSSEQKYKTIIENSVHAFLFAVPDGSILETNRAALAMFGYTADEFKQIKRWHILEQTEHYFSNALIEREKKGFTITEAIGIKKNGDRFPVEVSSNLFKDFNGEQRSSMMISDISIRKKAEADMKLTNERYNLVVKATKDLVWDWDLTTDKVYRQGYNLTGTNEQKSNDFIENIKDWTDHIHPEDKERIKERIIYYKNSSSETDFNFEYRFRKEDGTYVYINDKGYLIRNEHGKVIRMIGAAEDITERKQHELAIEESEQRYKMFIKHSTEGIWRIELPEALDINTPLHKLLEQVHANAYLAECNDAFAKMYGFNNPEEIVGTKLSALLPASNPVNQQYLIKFLSNNFKVENEISYELDKNRNELIVANNMIGNIENGFLKRAWGTQRDITLQKKAERALAASENHLRTIAQADPECIKLLSKDGIILEMNPAGLEMIDADSEDQVLGKNALNLVLPKYQDAFKQMLTDGFAGKKVKLVFEIIGFKGRRLFMESHCVPLRNDTNNIISLMAVTRDITESRNAQTRLIDSEERYRYLFNNNPASTIIWEIETMKIIEVNETAVKLYGYSREEFLQMTVMDLRPENEQKKLRELEFNGMPGATEMETSTWDHITKDGSRIIMEITPYKIEFKGQQAILSLSTNITEKVLLENSLIEERKLRQQQITEAVITGQEKERTELGEELHDNINQILASTKLYIECALKDKNPRFDLMAASKSLVEKAMTEIRNLSKSLLPPSLGEIGLHQALQELIDNIKQVNPLQISLKWNDTCEAEFDNKLKLTIFRIVQEQINNVIKHADATKACISIEKIEENLVVSIKDDGLGFNTALKKNGVGLRNISSRAEVNNGKVSIISKPGEGCLLIVRFTIIDLEPKTVISI